MYKYSILKACVSKTVGFILTLFCFMCVCITFKMKLQIIFLEILTCIYTGCPGGNVPDFGRMSLRLKYTDITQNTYIRSWNCYGDNGERKVWSSCGSTYCICFAWRVGYGYRLHWSQKRHNTSQNRLQIRNWNSKTLLFMSAATLKPMRLEWYLPRLSGVSV